MKGGLGRRLMLANAAMTRALSPAHTHLPWVTFNGVKLHPPSVPRPLSPRPPRAAAGIPSRLCSLCFQEHTEELEVKAMSSLLLLVCQLYQVTLATGTGTGGGTGTLGRWSPFWI